MSEPAAVTKVNLLRLRARATKGPWREGWDYRRLAKDRDDVVAFAVGPQIYCKGVRIDDTGIMQPSKAASEQMQADAEFIVALVAAYDAGKLAAVD